MKFLRNLFAALVVAAFASTAAWSATITQLGFILDASGSVTTSNYNLMRTGLNSALEALPTDGSVEITVTSFSSNVATVVAPTILTAASLTSIQSAITSHGKSGGVTNTGLALRNMTDLLTGSSLFGEPDTNTLINLLTDGVPCCDDDSDQQAIDGAAYADAEGIGALSIEAIGSGVTSDTALALLQSLAFPKPATILAVNQTTNIPNPLGGSWVLPVSDFNALAPVLEAKVIASITPDNPVPEPGTMLLLSIGLLGLAYATSRRRAL